MYLRLCLKKMVHIKYQQKVALIRMEKFMTHIVNGVVQHNSGCISDMKKGLLATH